MVLIHIKTMLITSLTNPLIKKVVSLKQKKNRDYFDSFIFESGKLFEEAVRWHIPLTHVFYTEKWMERATESQLKAFLSCSDSDIQCICVDENVIKKLSQQNQPEGIFCAAKKIRKAAEDHSTAVILEDVQDPGNVGTIIRTADAAGFDCIITSSKTADIYNDKVLRGSMGSVFHLDFIQSTDLKQEIIGLKQKGYTVIGSALDGQQTPFQSAAQNKIALILGNESKGMSDELKALCDTLLCIPMYGNAESLNVGIAAGILMYDIARQMNNPR